MKKIFILVVICLMLIGTGLKPSAEEVKINVTVQTTLSGDAAFNAMYLNFDTMYAKMLITLEGKRYEGISDLLAIYQGMTVDERPVALKFVKLLVVNAFNSAMGTSFTWEQVPNSIFDRTPEPE
jgi:hypothetical protein